MLTQSWIRNIELCCNCSYGHWTFCLLQSLLSLQLALLIHSNSLFCVSFVLVKHLHSLQKSMPCVTLGASVTVLFFFVTIIVHLKYILLSLIESFVPNCNDLYIRVKGTRQKKPVLFAWLHLPILCCVTSAATQALGHLDQLLYTHKNPTEYR